MFAAQNPTAVLGEGLLSVPQPSIRDFLSLPLYRSPLMLLQATLFVHTRYKAICIMLLVRVQYSKTVFMLLASMYVDCLRARFIRIGSFARLGSSNAIILGTEYERHLRNLTPVARRVTGNAACNHSQYSYVIAAA